MRLGKKIAMGLSLIGFFFICACGTGNEGTEGQDLAGASQGQVYDQAISAATAPRTRITSKPPATSYSSTATFKFSCTNGPCTFKCSLDSQSPVWTKCKSPKTYTGLPDAFHTFQVKAFANHQTGPVKKYTWTIETNLWFPTSTTNAPGIRDLHTAVWTGTQMIIWGGEGSASNDGRYNPTTDSWIPVSSDNAPSARYRHTAVWTGSKMIVWGGNNFTTYVNTGGIYNPATNSWIMTSTINAPPTRYAHTAVWDSKDSQMIVWGGYNGSYLNTGGKYSPRSNSWEATSTDNAPSIRAFHTAVWTAGAPVPEMIIWGGQTGASSFTNTGAIYYPSGNSWTATSLTNAPQETANHSAVWTGTEMIVWGGWTSSVVDTSGRYDPEQDLWNAISSTNAPVARGYQTAVWTAGASAPMMILWGGCDSSFNPLNTGGRYDPSSNSWTDTSTGNAPSGRFYHSAVWAKDRMIIWGGRDGLNSFNTGGMYWP